MAKRSTQLLSRAVEELDYQSFFDALDNQFSAQLFDQITALYDGTLTVDDARTAYDGGERAWDDDVMRLIAVAEKNEDVSREHAAHRAKARDAENDRRSRWRDDMIARRVQPEAPFDAPMGAFLFADQRPQLPPEPDTELEARLYDAIDSHFNFAGEIPPELAAELKECLRRGWYKRMLRRPKRGTVYRGLRVGREWLEKHVDGWTGELTGSERGRILYEPAVRYSTSWSIDLRTAQLWGNVILVASTRSNPLSFIDGEQLYTLPRMSRYRTEREVIGLGTIKCREIRWKFEA